jgi:hypothetical protein
MALRKVCRTKNDIISAQGIGAAAQQRIHEFEKKMYMFPELMYNL